MAVSRNWLVTGLIVILAFIHFSLGIVFTVEAFLLQEFSRYTQLTWITCTGLGSAAAADLLIAISMCYYLFRSRTGFQKTDSMITTLMLYSINTGLITSIVATGAVIAFATMPLNFIWLGFFWVLGKCYVNSLLASLNGRESLRERSHVDPSSFLQLSTIRRDDELPGPRSRVSTIIRRPAPTLSVTVETTTEYKSDFLNSPVTPSLVSTTFPDTASDPDKLKGSDSTPSLVPLVPRPVRHRTLL
ncbi:hypothetical protein HETIRDRAFT_173484 [Heterobasidion irregulare TC 32-1]|uniref:DUF6534 domain-containing protein n=1 Tax=Heterobasidion irregulare (strain TC 32-1) TaxID=747525 RepID=W4K9S7_HETIT|nr:uncharacterized protein HETIRDRAFT_173484 [Heterobasidion irregulare TC 32-1]ETW81806.1 hypothetical protein HETIRDRAFT_173484 [Heterobasidion irregulare TC 32-1]